MVYILYGKFERRDSTISHVGFILLALAINSEQSIDSLIFYIIQYSITNLNTFLIILALGYIIFGTATTAKTDIKYITELKGQIFTNPLLSLSLAICLFSMAGIPPLMGFFGKQFVLYSAIQSGYYFISIVGIIVSVISASYYLKIIRVLATTTPTANYGEARIGSARPTVAAIGGDYTDLAADSKIQPVDSTAPSVAPTAVHSFLISTLTLSILLFVLKPSILLNSTQLLSLSLFYY